MEDLKLHDYNGNEIDSLLQTVKVVSEDIGTSFGIEKYAALAMKRRKEVESNKMDLIEGRVIRSADDVGYMYIRILDKSDVCQHKMKKNVKKEYLKRVKSILKFKCNARNKIQATNTWAIPAIHYGASIVKWTMEKLKYLDRKTRKLITLHRRLHPRSNIQKVYINRNEGKRLIRMTDCVDN